MQIKCTSCGASQELLPNNQCGFCGSTIETEKAQENFKSSISGEVGNLMIVADTAIEATNWEEALSFYNQALTKDITNSDAWLGKGIAIVYTSKIGDIKTTEAIAYWKNAIKHAQNTEAMSKRVAKEINIVVNSFYPTIENHYIQFHNLENSYQELVSRFATLESAQDFATYLDETNVSYSETGYKLCRRVIELPKKHASATSNSALAEGIMGQFSSNKYSRQSASSGAFQKINEATKRKKEINIAAKTIFLIEEKYLSRLEKLNPNKNYTSSRSEFENSSEGKQAEIQKAFKENPIGGWKVWWEKQSKIGKIAWIIFIIIMIIGAIVNAGKN